MTQLEKRGERLARARQQIAVERLVALLIQEFPGVRFEADQSHIRMSGVGVVKRWLTDTSLRFVGGMMKTSAK